MLYTNDFDDNFQLMFCFSEVSFPFRHAYAGETPHIYRLATRRKDSVLLQAGVMQYDDQGRLGDTVEVYLPSFLRIIHDHRIKYEAGKYHGQVFLSMSAFNDMCERLIQPKDSVSLPSEAKVEDPHESYFELGVRESMSDLREHHRTTSLIIPFEELGVHFHYDWGRTFFEPKTAEYFAHRTLYGYQFFHLPCFKTNLRELLSIDHLVSPCRGFEAYSEPSNLDSTSSYLFITNSADCAGHSVFFERSSCFLVLDVFEYQSQTQVALLRLPPDAIEFFRSMHMNRLDDVVAEAREHFCRRLGTSPNSPTTVQEELLKEDPFFWGTWKSILPPLKNAPENKISFPPSVHSNLVKWTTQKRAEMSKSDS